MLDFTASPDNATQKYLFSVPMDGTGKLVKVTSENQNGTHSYNISEDGKYAVHIYSSFEVPNIINLVELPSHTFIRSLVDNKSLVEKVNSIIKKGKLDFF